MVLMMLILLVSHDLDIEMKMLATLIMIQKGYTLSGLSLRFQVAR